MKPYLSWVLAVRNDNYGGDFEFRLRNMLRWSAWHLKQAKIPAECILVNYNPVPDRDSIAERVRDLFQDWGGICRVITVPASFHERLNDPAIRKPVPLYEYIAKNIGIRRAEGEFILSANPDILPEPGIFQFIGRRQLQKEKYYRADRADFLRWEGYDPIPGQFSARELRQRAFRLFLKGNTVDLKRKGLHPLKLYWLRRQNARAIQRNFWLVNNWVYANQHSIPVNFDNLVHRYHCNCSGDFMLMHRDHWQALHGHPEKTYLAIHTDALFVVQAGMSGLDEVVLPWLIHHQDHTRRYESAAKPEGDIHNMFKWFIREGEAMRRSGQSRLYNDADWGFASEDFPEIQI